MLSSMQGSRGKEVLSHHLSHLKTHPYLKLSYYPLNEKKYDVKSSDEKDVKSPDEKDIKSADEKTCHLKVPHEGKYDFILLDEKKYDLKLSDGISCLKALHEVIQKLRKLKNLSDETKDEDQKGLLALWKMQGIQEFIKIYMNTKFRNKSFLEEIHLPFEPFKEMDISTFYNTYILNDLNAIFKDRCSMVEEYEGIHSFNRLCFEPDFIFPDKQYSLEEQVALSAIQIDKWNLADSLIIFMEGTVKELYIAMKNKLYQTQQIKRTPMQIALKELEALKEGLENYEEILGFIETQMNKMIAHVAQSINKIHHKLLKGNIDKCFSTISSGLKVKKNKDQKAIILEKIEPKKRAPDRPAEGYEISEYVSSIQNDLDYYFNEIHKIKETVLANKELLFESASDKKKNNSNKKKTNNTETGKIQIEQCIIEIDACIQLTSNEQSIFKNLSSHLDLKASEVQKEHLDLLIPYHNNQLKKLMDKYNKILAISKEKESVHAKVKKQYEDLTSLEPTMRKIPKLQNDKGLENLVEWAILHKKNIKPYLEHLKTASLLPSCQDSFENNVINMAAIMNVISMFIYQMPSSQCESFLPSNNINYPSIVCLRHILMHSVERVEIFSKFTDPSRDDLQQASSYINALFLLDGDIINRQMPEVLKMAVKINEERKEQQKINESELIENAVKLTNQFKKSFDNFNPKFESYFKVNKLHSLSESMSRDTLEGGALLFDGLLQLLGAIFLTLRDAKDVSPASKQLVKEMEYVSHYRSCKTHSGYVYKPNVYKALETITSEKYIEMLNNIHTYHNKIDLSCT